MIRRIYGRAGSGKSQAILDQIQKSLKMGKRTILMVPEQETLQAEAKITSALSGENLLLLEVLNFSRLSDVVFRKYGGISYHYLDRGGQMLMIWQALEAVAESLTVFQKVSVSEKSILSQIYESICNFSRYGITPKALEEMAKELSEQNQNLSAKLQDLSIVYGMYRNMYSGDFDDPLFALDRLVEALEKNHYFSGADVYFDSFDSYSPQEYRVIERILAQAENVTFSFCMEGKQDTILFDSVQETSEKIEKMALGSEITDIILEQPHRFVAPELLYLEKSLWMEQPLPVWNKGDFSAVSITSCEDWYAEAEYVALTICKLVRSGCRYRDIAVISRDSATYQGILDAALERYEIPYDTTEKKDLLTKPLARLLISALYIHVRGFRLTDVISYLKTGYAGIEDAECDLLETYAHMWNLQGHAWEYEEDWQMNPSGYREMSLSDSETLEKLNAIKRKALAPLFACLDVFRKDRPSVREVTEVLYDFLLKLEIPNRLLKEEWEEGNAAERTETEQEEVQVWNAIMKAFDQLVSVCGNMQVTSEKYVQLLTMLLSNMVIGNIPASIDRVEVGTVPNFRPGMLRYAILIGVNDGVFPAQIKENTVFTDLELKTLKAKGMEFCPESTKQNALEYFIFYKAVTAASHGIMLTYSLSNGNGQALASSFVLQRIVKLFGEKVTRHFSYNSDYAIEKKEAALSNFELFADSEYGRAFKQLLNESRNEVTVTVEKIAPEKQTLSVEAATLAFHKDLAMTYSRIERYVECKFSYICHYILGLTPYKKVQYGKADIGTYVHELLEKSLIELKGRDFSEVTREELDSLVTRYSAEYVQRITDGKTNGSLSHRIKRLEKAASALLENICAEFAQSKFSPEFFELPLSSKNLAMFSNPFELSLKDGNFMRIFGIADRVDVMKEEDGSCYFRVVDYKTNSKKFHLKHVALGLNLQMLLYMFALWKNPSEKVLDTLNTQAMLPAGILYFDAAPPESDVLLAAEEAQSKVSQQIAREGLLLNDERILRAMDANLEGKYIPISQKKDGTFSSKIELETLEEMGSLMEEVCETLRGIGADMKQGKADPSPLVHERQAPCSYCEMKSVCRKAIYD